MEIVYPSMKKRLIAGSIDLAITCLLFALLYFGVAGVIYERLPYVQSSAQTVEEYRLISTLYVEEDGKAVEPEEYAPALLSFFSMSEEEIAPLKIKDRNLTFYQQYMVSSGVFVCEGGLFENCTLAEGKTAYDEEGFYRVAYKTATSMLFTDPVLMEISSQISWIRLALLLTTTFLATLVFYLIVPLCLKNGRTIGKKLMSLRVVSTSGYRASSGQIVLRYAVLYILEVALSCSFYGLPAIISFGVLTLGPKHRAFHDSLSVTMVVDEKASVLFVSAEEEENHLALAAEKRRSEMEKTLEERFHQAGREQDE